MTRLPSHTRSHWLVETGACAGPEGLAWIVQWVQSVEEVHPPPETLSVYALRESDGSVIAQGQFDFPGAGDVGVVGILAESGSCAVIVGEVGGRAPEVKSFWRFALDGDDIDMVDKIQASREDTYGLIGGQLVNDASSILGEPTPWILAARESEGVKSILVVSGSLGGPARSHCLRLAPDDRDKRILDGWCDPSDGTVVLNIREHDAPDALVAYDLANGKVKWRSSAPDGIVFTPLRCAFREENWLVAFALNQNGEAHVGAIDLTDGAAKLLLSPPNNAHGSFSHGQIAAMKDGRAYAVCNDDTPGGNECRHQILSVPVTGGEAEVVDSVRITRRRGDPVLGGSVAFLLPAENGYWVGLAGGVIGYRLWASDDPPQVLELD